MPKKPEERGPIIIGREDLSEPLTGIIATESPNLGINEGEKTRFAFHIGRWVAPLLEIDHVSIHELGEHLETFSGIEVTDPESNDAWLPGTRFSGVHNLNFGFVFLTQIGEIAVPQEETFYNAEEHRDK